jgi:hypothetical protein
MNLNPSAALWLASSMLQAAALFFAIYRKHPELSAYLAFRNILTVALWASLPRSSQQYAGIYWTGQALDSGFCFLILHGIFRRLFAPYAFLPRQTLTNIILAVSIACAVVLTLISANGIVGANLSTAMIVATILLIIIPYSQRLGIPMRKQNFGIACGFCFYTAVRIFTAALWSRFPSEVPMISYIDRLAWLVMLTIWTTYLCYKPQPARSITMDELRGLKKKTLHMKEATTYGRDTYAHRYPARETA